VNAARKVRYVTLIFIIANLALGAWFFLRGGSDSGKVDADLRSPRMAIEALGGGTIFFNEIARPFLIERKGGELSEEERNPRSQRSKAYAAALSDPDLWRKIDRRYHFDAVLLSGDPAAYRPLLRHLIASTDWRLTYLDHSSYVFRRAPAEVWRIAMLDTVRARFEKASAAQQGDFLSQVAGKLSAIDQLTAAKRCLDEALKIDPRAPDAWTQLAAYHAHFSQWPDALTKADKALEIDPNFIPAMASKAQILVAMRRTDDAFAVAERIYRAAPKDPAMLFLVAKVAHAAHAYWREVEALHRLIALAEKNGQPVSGYRIYLAQAYAAQGEATPAVEHFEKALEDSSLSEEQRAFVRESIEQIKSRVSM
jgi:tetratricopeptide (TPR) repeat protein